MRALPLLIGLLLTSTTVPAFAMGPPRPLPPQARPSGFDAADSSVAVVRASALEKLALDQPWHGLPPDHQAQVRDWYDGLPSADEPPFPAKGLGAIYQPLITMQDRVVVEGPLFASVTVDAGGKATQVSFLQIPDPKLKDVLAAILLGTAYKPGLCSGTPCAMEFPVQAEFAKR